MIRKSGVALLFLFLFFPLLGNAASIVTLDSRPGVQQKFLLIETKQPIASVIVFAGGHGNLKLRSSLGTATIGWGENNFLVRTREDFAKQGFVVAVVDAPSDHKGKRGMLGGFRYTDDHATDIDHVIAYLKKEYGVPVWLVGTSRGTESATNSAIRSKEKPRGLILTSTMTVRNSNGVTVTEMSLDKVQIPTLIIAHEDDECWATPATGAKEIKNMLVSAPKVEVRYFSGGDESISKPCRALSRHGFLGIEEAVVNAGADFIKANN